MLASDIYQKEETSMPQARRIMLAKIEVILQKNYAKKTPETKESILKIREELADLILYE